MASGVTCLGSFVPKVSAKLRNEAEQIIGQIKAGRLQIFRGPLVDREGKIRLVKGQSPTTDWMMKMNFFVPGVEGNLPRNM